MRIAVFAIAAVCVLPCVAQTVSDDRDGITGERIVSYIGDGSTDASKPVLNFSAVFVDEVPDAAIGLVFVSADQGGGVPRPRFASCHKVEWFVDGQPLPTHAASHRGSVVDGELIEMIDQSVDAAWAGTIASAQRVRYRVCRDEYSLTTNDIQAFAMIAAKLRVSNRVPSASRAGASPSPPTAEVDYKGMSWRPKHQESLFPTKR